MQTRPKALLLLSLCLVAVALSFPLQIMWMFGHGPFELDAVFFKLTALNRATMLAILASAFCVYHAMPQTLPMTLGTVLLVNWNNYVAGSFELNYDWTTTVYASLGYLALHGLMLEPNAAKVLLDPKLRWWRYPSRHKAQLDLQVRRLNGEVFSALTHDMSTGGAFIPFFGVQDYSHHSHSPPLIPNDEEYVMVDFAINDVPINCQAKVVRKTGARGSYPAGVGLQFLDLKKKEKRLIRRYIQNAPVNFRQAELSA